MKKSNKKQMEQIVSKFLTDIESARIDAQPKVFRQLGVSNPLANDHTLGFSSNISKNKKLNQQIVDFNKSHIKLIPAVKDTVTFIIQTFHENGLRLDSIMMSALVDSVETYYHEHGTLHLKMFDKIIRHMNSSLKLSVRYMDSVVIPELNLKDKV